MIYKIIFTKTFDKKALKFFKKHKGVFGQYKKVLKLLELNIFHPSLRLHKLDLKKENIYSVSINMSYRITLELIIKDKEVILVDIGDHDFIY